MKTVSNDGGYMTREAFVKLLFDKGPEDLTGLIPSENMYLKDEDMDRKSAATLIHIFLREVLKEPDEMDIESASILRDLYDCRVCVNHIAQVYLKGIMEAFDYPELSKTGRRGEFLLFNGSEKVTREAAEDYRDRAIKRAQRLKNPTK